MSNRREEIDMKNRTHGKVLATALSLVLAGSLLTSCGNGAKCDDLLNALSYGAWSESDSDWYDANCR